MNIKKLAVTFMCSGLLLYHCLSFVYGQEVSTQTTTTSSTATSVTATEKKPALTIKEGKKKVITKRKISKKKKKAHKRKEKGKEISYQTPTGFTIMVSPKDKVVVQTKRSETELHLLYNNYEVLKKKQRKNKLQQKELKQKISIIQSFKLSWKWDSFIGVQVNTEFVNNEADKKIRKLMKDVNDPLLTGIDQFHFGLQEQAQLLTLAKNPTLNLNDLLESLSQRYLHSEKLITDRIHELDVRLENTKHSIQIIENKKAIVFDPMNLLIKSNLTENLAKEILKGTALESCAPYFIECEQKYGVNAISIMAISVQESGWGTSRRAREDNNLTGYGVYSDSAKGINAQTKEENLIMTAKLLKERYLTKTGSYFRGTSLMSINENYCTSSDWALSVTKHAYTLMDQIR